MGEVEESDHEKQMQKESQITALKAEIFDFLEAQEQLQSQMRQIEEMKQAKVMELNQIRSG